MLKRGVEGPGGAAGDLYGVLGVPPDATQEVIVHAYRQQARTSHPDVQPGDLDATSRFRTLTHAYEVLSDPSRRAGYDRSRGASPRLIGPESSDLGPWRRSGPTLWAGPVRVEGSPGERFGELRRQLSTSTREIDGLVWPLLRFLAEGWFG